MADYEAPIEDLLKSYLFGLEGTGPAYQNDIHHIFVDHIERDHVTDLYMINLTYSDHPTPVVNMVVVRQLSNDPSLPTESLHNILNKSLDDYSEGSTKTVPSCPAFPPGFGGMIFHISHDSITKDGETAEEREAHLAKKASRQHHRDAEAAQGADEDGRGLPRHQRNLEEAFDMVGDQPVYQTPSANLVVAFNELDKLPHSPEVE